METKNISHGMNPRSAKEQVEQCKDIYHDKETLNS